MAGSDNSFERQMLDFYGGIKGVEAILEKLVDLNNPEKNAGLAQIALDITLKDRGIPKKIAEANKARLQVALYAQLEKDRQEAGNAA